MALARRYEVPDGQGFVVVTGADQDQRDRGHRELVVHQVSPTGSGPPTGRHLDSTRHQHYDALMRTTVTLDPDVERLLRETMHRTRRSFKETLNRALRDGLTRRSPVPRRTRFVLRARPMGLREGLDPTALNKLADELEVDAFTARTGGSNRGAKRR
jgi:hypothetical protein